MNFVTLAVSAVEQLQVMASKRQYKEAAAQLEVPFFFLYQQFLAFVTSVLLVIVHP